ncbi:MAG: flagellar hook-associated protein FlgL [Succinivibrionaceae bacterium]|nr:flagellar hook-associated protein FlgL [Succinivibrionaceae bacterium]
MRITTNMSFDRSIKYMQNTNTRLDQASKQYNTGLKFDTAAEDPTGMGNKLRLEAEISTYTQYSVNAGLAQDSLGLEETSLSSMYEILGSVKVEMQSAVNGTLDNYNFEAIATSLEESLNLLFDLTNTKTADGEYIFSGNQSLQPTMVKQSDGTFKCQADSGFRQVKVAPSVKVTTSDSGLGIFEQCQLCRTASSDAASTISYKDNEQFNKFVNDYYQNGGNNDFTVSVATDGKYELKSLRDNTVLQSGTLGDSKTITFNGMEIKMNGDYTQGALNSTIKLDKPKNDNFLNSISRVIDVLRDDNVSHAEKMSMLASGQVNIEYAKENVNVALGHVGGRLTNIEDVINSNSTLSEIKTQAKANISEVDVYEATENLLKQQTALNFAQQTFSKVNGTTLFDYI